MKEQNRAILDELALRDFGTTDISISMRGKARQIAKERGITPLEGLKILGEQESVRSLQDKQLSANNKKRRKGQKKKKQIQRERAQVEIGRPIFAGLVSGGAPGLRSQNKNKKWV